MNSSLSFSLMYRQKTRIIKPLRVAESGMISILILVRNDFDRNVVQYILFWGGVTVSVVAVRSFAHKQGPLEYHLFRIAYIGA